VIVVGTLVQQFGSHDYPAGEFIVGIQDTLRLILITQGEEGIKLQ
jgi:hypothetical protein